VKSETSIIPTSVFKRKVKELKKKYPHIGEDLKRLGQHLDQNLSYGIHLGSRIYKIRLRSSDQPKGKKGGYRVITFYSPKENFLYLLTIYHKSQIENIPIHKIIEILKREGLI
jgi:mRNA-degrading endonuclease RelE of RelBE toxin-antitoxin system